MSRILISNESDFIDVMMVVETYNQSLPRVVTYSGDKEIPTDRNKPYADYYIDELVLGYDDTVIELLEQHSIPFTYVDDLIDI